MVWDYFLPTDVHEASLKSYISADMLKELYKSAFDQKLKILIIESYQRPYLSEYEKNWIIDKDKCIIELEWISTTSQVD